MNLSQQEKQEEFLHLPLEEVIGDRFGRYSKYIIQDRALPDVRDGLKPVQRRILYAMHVEKNTHDKNFRKAAKTVGNVIGNYHPHGDTSVYEAMVRLSQNWKVRNVLVEMHGNNGSVDGDPAAAMRYTEARLSPISSELLRDIEKETVDFIPNFDDTAEEPVVLPARFPNLLANGSTGISAGYATDIPPHNLAEVIDAVIMKIDKPNASVDNLMQAIQGPDFPTGGIIQGIDGIKKAYETGKGKIVIRGRATVETMRNNREKIVITEIPFEVNKANMVKKIDELRNDRKVEGIAEVRDETDRTGLRVVIELRKDANSQGVLHYLYKNTDLQVIYNFNMVAIQNKTPKLLSLAEMLDAYIGHQKEVVTRQTEYDLKKANARAHIVEGLIKAISILDELIATIRASTDKQNAKTEIINKYGFSDIQAEAIVMLQLYRLTNTDITSLEKEAVELREKITDFTAILASERKLLQIIKAELRQLKRTYGDPRRTSIEDKIEVLTINIDVTVLREDVIVTATRDGYIKRTSIRSYAASNGTDLAIKEGDHLISMTELNTTDRLLLFTNKGKYLCISVHELPEIRWKDIGQHISNLVGLENDEHLVQCIPVREFGVDDFLIFFTRNGMIKRSKMELYNTQRGSRTLIALNLKVDDTLINVMQTSGFEDVFIASNKGYGLLFNEAEITVVGQRAAGVKAILLKEDEFVVSGQAFTEEPMQAIVIVTQRGHWKRIRLNVLEKSSRMKRGSLMLKELKVNPHRVKGAYILDKEVPMLAVQKIGDHVEMLDPNTITNGERTSNGTLINKDRPEEVLETWLDPKYDAPFERISKD